MSERTPAEAFPPGDFLREEIEERGWTQTEFAEILQSDSRTVSEIVNGKRSITPDMAKRIGAALGTSAELWLNLQNTYQLWKLRGDTKEQISKMARLREFAPVGELVRRGWIEHSENIQVLERNVLSFFGLESFGEDFDLPVAARKSTSYSSATPAQKAWVCRARQMSRAVHAKKFTQARFDSEHPRLKACTENAEDIRQVPRILADVGIRVVAIQHLPGTKIDGACLWEEGQPVVALSLRYDRIDWFWFTLMHELGHVKNEDFKDDSGIDEAMDEDVDMDETEKRANEFATDTLIGEEALNSFINRVRPLYSKKRIEAFAMRHDIHPGIVVGQLHYRKEIPYKNLRKMLVPVRDIFLPSVLTDGWGHVAPQLNGE